MFIWTSHAIDAVALPNTKPWWGRNLPRRIRVSNSQTFSPRAPVKLWVALDQSLPDRRAKASPLCFRRHCELVQVRDPVNAFEHDRHGAEGFAGQHAFERKVIEIIGPQPPPEAGFEQMTGPFARFVVESVELDDALPLADQRAGAAVSEQFTRQALDRGDRNRGGIRQRRQYLLDLLKLQLHA